MTERAWQLLMSRIDDVRAEALFEITHRPMFGGAMVYADGQPIASLSEAGLAVKLGSDDQQRLLAVPGAARLRYSPSAPESQSYVVVPDDVVADDDQLLHWLAAAHRTASASRANDRRPRLERRS